MQDQPRYRGLPPAQPVLRAAKEASGTWPDPDPHHDRGLALGRRSLRVGMHREPPSPVVRWLPSRDGPSHAHSVSALAVAVLAIALWLTLCP
jgi:hypothetical protein